MKKIMILMFFLCGFMVYAENFRVTKPEVWRAVSIKEAMQKLYGTSKSMSDDRIIIKAPKVASNGGAVPISVMTKIPAKTIAVLQDVNPTVLVAIFTVHDSNMANYTTKIKMQSSGKIVVVVEGLDGKLYSNTHHLEVALGGCEGCGSAVSSYRRKSPYARGASVKAKPFVQKVEREKYDAFTENRFKEVASSPLSTFSTDVDTASYSTIRSYVMDRKALPSKDAVRIEEMVNYFTYNYKEPNNTDPFYINTKVGDSIWNNNSKVLQIGLQTKKVDMTTLPASNMVFLLDVSGSMKRAESLPLLVKSLKILTQQLRKKDRVSIVVYAGASGLILDRARGDEKTKIYDALEGLYAGGSTAGESGIQLAYETAEKSFIEGGNNRIILATDGDFNVGISSQSDLVKLIEEKRKSGIYLSVLGFGRGNYQDNKMEQLADHGNGNYAYIDTLLEAKKVLVTQMSGTLYTVAKDVKVQVEFNPSKVHAYRLIGYENRVMANEDFNNDKIDAAEIGMGHSVTALYEVVLQKNGLVSKVDTLKYQSKKVVDSDEFATVKIRYKKPDSNTSIRMSKALTLENSDIDNDDSIFAQTVAGFGMLLRDSEYAKDLKISTLIEFAKDSKGKDREGYRAEFIKMMEKVELLK